MSSCVALRGVSSLFPECSLAMSKRSGTLRMFISSNDRPILFPIINVRIAKSPCSSLSCFFSWGFSSGRPGTKKPIRCLVHGRPNQIFIGHIKAIQFPRPLDKRRKLTGHTHVRFSHCPNDLEDHHSVNFCDVGCYSFKLYHVP